MKVSLLWSLVASGILVAGLGLVTGGQWGKRSEAASSVRPVTPARKGVPPSAEAVFTNRSVHVWDSHTAPAGQLFSKRPVSFLRTGVNLDAVGDLWYQDGEGHERFVASAVISARFSPDGNKIAYGTCDRDLCVQTVAGKVLAQIPRAIDPSWRSDSRTLWFLAVPSLDYPELSQPSSYDLEAEAP